VKSNSSKKRPLRLNKGRKKFLGVCAGIADYLEVEPWSVRLVFLVSVFFGG
jgi:phage shock protein C